VSRPYPALEPLVWFRLGLLTLSMPFEPSDSDGRAAGGKVLLLGNGGGPANFIEAYCGRRPRLPVQRTGLTLVTSGPGMEATPFPTAKPNPRFRPGNRAFSPGEAGVELGALTARARCGGAGVQATGARALQRFVGALGPRAERFRSGARPPRPGRERGSCPISTGEGAGVVSDQYRGGSGGRVRSVPAREALRRSVGGSFP
jgi:hypothetical protein